MKRLRPFIHVLAVAGCVLAACADDQTRDPSASVTRLPEPTTRDVAQLDERLMIGLAQAKNFHHKADVYLTDARLDDAIDAVTQILSIPFPAGAAEAEDVTLDARARLAKLLVAHGRVEDALSVVDAGIAGAARRSFFLANLYTALGDVHEARARLMEDDDSDAGRAAARAAKREAIEAFDQSIAINRDLQTALMSEER